ncbi:MAG: DUF1634 domain-containing protein [Bacteroidota bacterium]|nr:DUF1634 domain-containing protein [Bacteroidota bacterium]MDP4232363.1 DUF1634 domain-containing protein [Bacteroidota bacterium]MDP4241500.1 DUF1634 domain-containing protein [Bacteroidota bacterium]MDP4289002.1 DUF1634 domain-containing protein [Bacteroidota bacterium]
MARQGISSTANVREEHTIEVLIGNMLRVCVITTIVIVLFGAALYLPSAFLQIPAFHVFKSEPDAFRSVAGILRAAFTGDGLAIVQAGMLLLILTPILRVAVSVFAFLYEKDYLYVSLTLLVLGLLLYSLWG